MNETATVVVVFCDLVESTALMSAVGDDAADQIRREMFTKWRAAIEGSAGTIVKTAGDGFMAVFPTSAGNAVRAADALQVSMSTIDSPRPLRLRIGIAAGEASHEDGDWFGTPVVEAARLCAAADPDEVLLSETARNLIGSRGGHEFTPVGSLTLKGLTRPLRTYALGPKARRRRTPTRGKWVAAIVVIALVAGGAVVVAVSEDGEDPLSMPTVAKPSYEVRLTQRDCLPEESAGDSTVTCQTLAVPENRARPHGRTVKLPVVHAPATDARAIAIPTVSIGLIASQPDDALRSASPLIRLGGRARAPSTPQLSCTEFDTSRAERLAISWNDAEGRYIADLRACLERLRGSGIDLSQYDQADIADDVRDLAYALKEPRISLVATSSFARAALVVIRRYPGLLESVIMNDPNVPPTNMIGCGWPLRRIAGAARPTMRGQHRLQHGPPRRPRRRHRPTTRPSRCQPAYRDRQYSRRTYSRARR